MAEEPAVATRGGGLRSGFRRRCRGARAHASIVGVFPARRTSGGRGRSTGGRVFVASVNIGLRVKTKEALVITRTSRPVLSGAAVAAALLLLAGCTGSPGDDPSSGASSPPSVSASGSPSGASDADAPDDAGSGASSTPAAADGAGGAGAAPESERCLTPDLTGSIAPGEGGGAAGHYEVRVVLHNSGDADCVLQGWPGVSFVGDGDGTQIGAAATLDRSSAHEPVTLAPGDSAHASLLVGQAESYGDGCTATPADGLRIYPPGETRSLFVENDELTLTGCAEPDLELLEAGAFQPGA